LGHLHRPKDFFGLKQNQLDQLANLEHNEQKKEKQKEKELEKQEKEGEGVGEAGERRGSVGRGEGVENEVSHNIHSFHKKKRKDIPDPALCE
jgi:hypothetical protein